MKKFGLCKKEKLCSARDIDALFGPGGASFARLYFPLRALARHNSTRRSDAPVAFLISVPKKRLRHAVERVLMRRRIREAYRLCRHDFPLPEGTRLDLAFVYVANKPMDFDAVSSSMRRILAALSSSLQPAITTDEVPS